MKALFGTVSLLIVLAVVGLVAVRQTRTALPTAGSAALGGAALPSLAGASATPREQSQQLQQRVVGDVARALEQGAAARRHADEP